MPLIPLHDLHDPRLEPYRNVRERDLAGRQNLFIAEGRVVLSSLVAHRRFGLHSVLVSQRRVPHLASLFEQLPEELPIYVLPHDTMETLVGFPIHRGLLAAGQRPGPVSAAQILASLPPGPATVLVLESLTNHDNTGACFRNAAAFGAKAVLINDRCCDPLYRKSLRVSAGHALALPFNLGGESTLSLMQALHDADFTTVAMTLAPGAQALRGMQRPAERIAICLGTEGKGLSPEATDSATLRVKMEMAPGVDSLNVATAGAVALFALQS